MNARAAASPGDSPAQAAEAAVGRKLRLLRRSRELSLQAVAGMTGLSIGLLSQIERGLSSPSVRNLVALSNAFDVPMAWFFDEAVAADDGEDSLVVRREARPRIAMHTTSMTKELLSPDRTRPLQTFLITVEPGGGTGEEPYSYPGEVNGYVLSGRLALWLDGRRLLLREGDSFAIPGDCPRRYGNPDPFQPTRLIWSIAR
ncbi:helix-turn-helix domain-containing protein [Enterovirga sp. CN4-39]|uniref:helix-turn-helix domain-containing protein n=1 Tax=Enterovirga sp. CN4-39 TaxID=3400910 RepID=UPI003C04C8DF